MFEIGVIFSTNLLEISGVTRKQQGLKNKIRNKN